MLAWRVSDFAVPEAEVVYIVNYLQVSKRLEHRHIAQVRSIVDEHIQTTVSEDFASRFCGDLQTLLVRDIRGLEMCDGDSIGRKSVLRRSFVPHQSDDCV